MSLTTDEMQLIETRVGNDGKNVVVTYLLWFFLGIFAAHRFYLGKPLSALLQIVSYFVLIGFVWWVVDFFLIPRMVNGKNDELRAHLADSLRRR